LQVALQQCNIEWILFRNYLTTRWQGKIRELCYHVAWPSPRNTKELVLLSITGRIPFNVGAYCQTIGYLFVRPPEIYF
jgi:hypothetical protein